MSADLCFTRDSFFLLSFFLSSFFAVWSPRSLNGTQLKSATWSEVSVYIYSLKTHVQNLGYPLPYKSGAQTPIFWTTSQLNGNFHGLYLWKERRYRQSVKCVDNYKESLTSFQNAKMSWTLAHKRLQTRTPFLPTYVNSAFHFVARLRRRRSANGTQPRFVKWWTVGHTNNMP